MTETKMIDLTSPETVEIKLDYTASGLALWVNVDGRCILRIYGIDQKTMQLEDNRLGMVR